MVEIPNDWYDLAPFSSPGSIERVKLSGEVAEKLVGFPVNVFEGKMLQK